MRIGIIGAAGTGKTMLATALSAHLGSAFVQDFVTVVLREQGRDSWKGVTDPKQRRKIREDALRRKTAEEDAAAAFVSDKTAIDYLAYWLQNQAEHEEPAANAAFLEQCKAAASRYDVFVYLPYREVVGFAVGRQQDPVHNLKVAAHKRGLLSVLRLPFVEAEYRFGEDLGAWSERWLAGLTRRP